MDKMPRSATPDAASLTPRPKIQEERKTDSKPASIPSTSGLRNRQPQATSMTTALGRISIRVHVERLLT